MELKLKPAFFWPINSTIVRTIKFSAGLAWLRIKYRMLWQIAPQRAIEHGARQLLTPPAHRFADAELHLMEEASLLRIPLVTGTLIGWRWGRPSDPAVVLVHGWGGRGTQLRRFIEPLRARGLSVVAYDAPGHGMTGGDESSLPHFLHSLAAVLDHLGPVHALVGHSMGGAVAAMIMARRPEAVRRGVLIAAPASLTEATYRMAAAMAWPPALTAAVRRRIEYRFGINWDDFEAERSAGNQPLLVIHDLDDTEVNFANGMRHLRAWQRARLFETRNLGHRRLLADPAVLAATADFLAGERL